MSIHPNSLETLKKYQVKKGEKGRNPNGRPFSLTAGIKLYLMEKDSNGITYKEKLERAIIARAMKKSDPLAKELWDRIDGKVPQQTDITSGGRPIPIYGGASKLPIIEGNIIENMAKNIEPPEHNEMSESQE